MDENRNAYSVLVGKTDGNKLLEIHESRLGNGS
jgi:hypothetical protein